MNNTILQNFEISAKSFPNKTFLSLGNESITYLEFELLSKAIASNLAKYELKNQPIVVETQKSIQTIALFFGVLYSGNFYVPIDCENPSERTNAIYQNVFSSMTTRLAICYDEGEYIIKELDDKFEVQSKKVIENFVDDKKLEQIRKGCNITDPIYMIYTSGSTGIPKGVIKSHLSVLSFVEAFVNEFDITSDEILGNQTPLYFDASAKDLYVAITVGATIELLPKEAFAFPLRLVQILNDKKITMIMWVPSALNLVSQFRVFNVLKPEYLKKVFFVGEVMPIKYINDWFKNVKAKYYNLYGSSETAGIVCYYQIDKLLDEDSKLPIGKKLSNAQILVVNESNQICKSGENGEIFIRGAMLASGYYDNGGLTEKVFVQNPLHTNFIDRVYKSGDIGYIDGEGNLVFVCRKDYQIKHMGHRIELGDIEVAVNAVPKIKECCAVYSEKQSKIVLYFSTFEQIENNIVYLKNNLQQKLPPYMIPNKFVYVDDLPKNSNGKIERKKLKELAG